MGWTVLYLAFGLVALWLLGEVLLQYKARLRWRVLAFCGFLGVVFGVIIHNVPVIALGAVAFAAGQTLVTLSFRNGFSTGWSIGGKPGSSRRRRGMEPMAPLPEEAEGHGPPPPGGGDRSPEGWGEDGPGSTEGGGARDVAYRDTEPGTGRRAAAGSHDGSGPDTGYGQDAPRDGYGDGAGYPGYGEEPAPAYGDNGASDRGGYGDDGYGRGAQQGYENDGGYGEPAGYPAQGGYPGYGERGGYPESGAEPRSDYGAYGDNGGYGDGSYPGGNGAGGYGAGNGYDSYGSNGHDGHSGGRDPGGHQGAQDTGGYGYPPGYADGGYPDPTTQGYGTQYPPPGSHDPTAQPNGPGPQGPWPPPGPYYQETPPGGVWVPQQRDTVMPDEYQQAYDPGAHHNQQGHPHDQQRY